MIWVIIIGVIGYTLIKFFSALNQDNYDLSGQTLDEKFAIVVDILNGIVYDGMGSVTRLDKRSFNLYEDGKNQIILFRYSTGHLTLIWKYKFFQKEIVHEHQFTNVRNLSIFEQQRIAEVMVKEMALVVQNHKLSVLGEPF